VEEDDDNDDDDDDDDSVDLYGVFTSLSNKFQSFILESIHETIMNYNELMKCGAGGGWKRSVGLIM